MNNELKRRVKVFKYVKVKVEAPFQTFKYIKSQDGEANFHQWGSSYEEFDSGPGNYTTAIIERDDGTIETPEASMIQFIKDRIRNTS